MADASAYVSAAADHRRKKSALDKARANYLCSQLRLRLQYAKLKVDHGWQTQTLNEVENLYFRHSQRRRLAAASASFSFCSTSSNGLGSTPCLPLGLSTAQTSASNLPTSNTLAQQSRHDNANAVSESPQVSPSTNTPTSSQSPDTPPAGDLRTCPDSPSKSATALNPSKAAQSYYPSTYNTPSDAPPYTPNPYAHYPARVMQGYTQAAPEYGMYSASNGGSTAYSPHNYLAKAYVSSSPFPINMPASPSAGAGAFGGTSQALTYDSFWSTHASWNVHAATAASNDHSTSAAPSGAVASVVPIPVPTSSSEESRNTSC